MKKPHYLKGPEGNEIEIAEVVQPKGNTWEIQKLVVTMSISAVCVLRCMVHYKVITWVQYSCTHWLHEDCVLDVIKDADDKVQLCPYCVT